MTNIVMAIALWCGNVEHGYFNTEEKIDQCRKQLFICVEKDPNGTKFLDCFKNKKLHD